MKTYKAPTGKEAQQSAIIAAASSMEQGTVNVVHNRDLRQLACLTKAGVLTREQVAGAVLMHLSRSDREHWLLRSNVRRSRKDTQDSLITALEALEAEVSGEEVAAAARSLGLDEESTYTEEETGDMKKVPSKKEQDAIDARKAAAGQTTGTEGEATEGGKKGSKKASAPKEPKAPRTATVHPAVPLADCPTCGAKKGELCLGPAKEGQAERKKVALPHSTRIKAAGLSTEKPAATPPAAPAAETPATPAAPAEGAAAGGDAQVEAKA
jgi:hypothetical protein